MATVSQEEIERLQRQLKEKTREIKELYDKLVEAGAMPLPDDFMDEVAGGTTSSPTLYPTKSIGTIR